MRAEVMVVGVYHLGETSDLVKVEGKEDKGLKPQAMEVVDALSRYNPTKIAVEAEWEAQSTLNKSYRKYQQGHLNPIKNEIGMIGFPLAKKLGIEEISCVDWMEDSAEIVPIDDVLQYANEQEPELHKEIMKMYIEPFQGEMEKLSGLSILEGFKRVNEPEMINKMHQVYMDLAMIGKENDYYAMDWLTWWYKRNLIIYTNVRRLIESPQDRVLLIIGGSHVHLINQFLVEADICKVINASDYLK